MRSDCKFATIHKQQARSEGHELLTGGGFKVCQLFRVQSSKPPRVRRREDTSGGEYARARTLALICCCRDLARNLERSECAISQEAVGWKIVSRGELLRT